MEIKKTTNENIVLTVAVTGRLDALTAPKFEKELEASLDGVKELVFDLKDLDYISSAGIRVFVAAQKKYHDKIKISLVNVKPDIMAIFKMTGVNRIMDISQGQ